MRLDKDKAIKLRLQGKSYSEINKLLGVSKATLSDWFANVELSEKAQERIQQRTIERINSGVVKRNRALTDLAQRRSKDLRQKAKKEIRKLSKREILLIGAALYWAEGYKRPLMRNGKIRTSHAVSLTNSDPQLVKLFLAFLRGACQVPEEKITANIRITEHQNGNYLLHFWSTITGIPYDKLKKFQYNTSAPGRSKKAFNILPYGTIQVRVNDTKLYHKIMGWIEGLSRV